MSAEFIGEEGGVHWYFDPEKFKQARIEIAERAVIEAAEAWARGPVTSTDLYLALLESVAKLREVRGK